MQNAKLAGNRPGQVALTAAAAMLLVSAVLLLVVRLPAEARANDRDISGVTLTSPSPGELVIAWDAPTDAPGDCRVTWKSPRQSGLHIKNDNTEAASVRHRRPPRVTRPEDCNSRKHDQDLRHDPRITHPVGRLSRAAPAPAPRRRAGRSTRRLRTGQTHRADRRGVPRGHSAGPRDRESLREAGLDDPGDTSITHYLVLRRDAGTHENGRYIVIDSDTGSAQVKYLDHTVENDRRYVYRIIAVNDHGESRPSGSARADTYLVATVPFPGRDDASPEG